MIAATALRSSTPVTADVPAGANVVPLGAPKRSRHRVRRGETLYGIGDPFRSLYVVRVGVLKTFTVSDEGLMQVTGFAMAGDVIGLDGIDTSRHQSSVVALEDCELFVLPFAQCEQWSQESAHGQRLMMRTLAREIVRSQELMIVLGTMRAEQRLATFLLDISERYGRLGYSRAQFLLRMTRQDIGSYLGLKLETVSRLLSRFQQEGFMQVQGKSISLLDFDSLRQLSGFSSERRRPAPDPILDREGELLVA
jgi:CRP/FNR family transcriptional regulator, anaerobic regulatory protein